MLISTLNHNRLYNCNMGSYKSNRLLILSLKLEIMLKFWVVQINSEHLQRVVNVFFFVLKNEFDFNKTHSKNSHLAFIWFIFSLKQPCKCVALFSSFIQKALWERGHRLSYYLWFVFPIHSISGTWNRNSYFSSWEPQKNEKRWQ